MRINIFLKNIVAIRDLMYPLQTLKIFINFYERLFKWGSEIKDFPRQLFSKPEILITSSSKDLPIYDLFNI